MEFIQVLISSLLPPSLSSLTSSAFSPISLVSSDWFMFPKQESLLFAPCPAWRPLLMADRGPGSRPASHPLTSVSVPSRVTFVSVRWTASQEDSSYSFAGPALQPQACRAREVLQARVGGGSWSNPSASGQWAGPGLPKAQPPDPGLCPCRA